MKFLSKEGVEAMKTEEELIEDLITAVNPTGDADERAEYRPEAARFFRQFNLMAAELKLADERASPAIITFMRTDDPALKARVDAWLAEGNELAKLVS